MPSTPCAPVRTSFEQAQRVRLRNPGSAASPNALLTDAVSRLTGEHRTRNDIEEVIGAGSERGLIVEPGKGRDQCEQVGTVDVGPRNARGVSAVEGPRACVVQRNAGG